MNGGLERAAGIFGHNIPENSATKEAQGQISGERYKRELRTREFGEPEALSTLPKSERRAYNQLVRAVRRWAEVYQVQEGPDERAHFYPPKSTKNQILIAGESDPKILSPYTVVLKGEDEGTFATVPMHHAYSEIIKKTDTLKLLRDAEHLSRDKGLKRYLQAKGRAMVNGNWEEADKLWLEMDEEPLVDIVIGFYDTYTDKFLGRKYAAEAWTGVLRQDATAEQQRFIDPFLDEWVEKTGGVRPRVKVRVDETRIMSGQAAHPDLKWSANSLPCQTVWREKYGSKFTIFEPAFSDYYEPREEAFAQYIHPNRRAGIPSATRRTAVMRRYSGHEIGHSLVPAGTESRMGAEKNWFNEYFCDVLSLEGYFDVPDYIYTHPREHEAAFATHLANGFIRNQEYKASEKEGSYFPSHAILLGKLLESKAVEAQDGQLTWRDMDRVRATVAEATQEVIKLATDAREKDIVQFKGQSMDHNIFDKIRGRAA